MTSVVCSLLMLMTLTSMFLQDSPPKNLKLEKGTKVIVRLKKELDSKTAKVGDVVELEVAKEVTLEGQILIAAGAPARGEITEAKKKDKQKDGRIDIEIVSAVAVDKQEVPMRGAQTWGGGEGRKTSILLGGRKSDIKVKEGTEITATVDEEKTITVK